MTINYNDIDKNLKMNIINQNIYHSKYGLYKQHLNNKLMKITNNHCKIEIPDLNKIPNVFVINKHPLNVVEGLGLSDIYPCVMHVVDRSFNGNSLHLCSGLKDHTLLLRTNFNAVFGQNNIFPLENTDCVYIKTIVTIRNKELNGLKDNEISKFSVIICSPIYKRKDLNENVSSTDYIKTISIIDNIFKTAIMNHNPILILTNFGDDDDDKNSTDDIINIYNACILKYGHMFTSIIIAIPEYEPILYNIYANKIIIPKNIA